MHLEFYGLKIYFELIDQTYCIEINLLLKMFKKDVLSKPRRNSEKAGRNSNNFKNLEEIQQTWRKFPINLWPPCLEQKSCKFLDKEYNNGINYCKMEILKSNDKHIKKHCNIL